MSTPLLPHGFPPLPPCPPSPPHSPHDEMHDYNTGIFAYYADDDTDVVMDYFNLPTNNICDDRKRTASTSQSRPSGRRTPSDASARSGGDSGAEKGKEKQTAGEKKNDALDHVQGNRGESKAPSLDVDIRNSLMLPSLSQRFSVLLPSLSSVPEDSLRTLLASQRARPNGPALTENEEELLLAELRGETRDGWDGQPPAFNADGMTGISPHGYHGSLGKLSTSLSSPSSLSASTSSPSVLVSDDGRGYTPISSSSTAHWPSSASPPPTSTSFSSFRTFGVSAEESDANANVKTKSYGFSGASGMREAEYIRKVKKSASQKDLKGSASSRKSTASDRDQEEESSSVPLPPKISPEKANAYYKQSQTRQPKRSISPSGSERTATPTSAIHASVSAKSRSGPRHSPSASATFPSVITTEWPADAVLTSAESEALKGKAQKNRKRGSMLAGMSAAQVKRISMALEEIGGELQRKDPFRRPSKSNEVEGVDEEEEMLETAPKPEAGRPRRPSDMRSEGSTRSTASSIFPFKMSPTNSTFTGNFTTDAPSPTRLPPSPRSHNLLAHVEEALPPIPMPVFTPTRSLPVKHRPTLSASTFSPDTPPTPVYVPGQPRPVGSSHRSTTSISSRSATPISYSPSSGTDTPEPPSVFEYSPSPFKTMPPLAPRGSSLARSQSVNQPSSNRFENGHRLSSSHSIQPPTPADTIKEEDDEDGEISDSEDYLPSSSDHYIPELKKVPGRRSVADSRNESEASVRQLQDSLGRELSANGNVRERAVSQQGTIGGTSTPATTVSATVDNAPMSSTMTLRRQASSGSLSSSFDEHENEDELSWNALDGSGPSPYGVESSQPSDSSVNQIDVLRKLSGVGLEEMAMLQTKLVQKAKQEREALRREPCESAVVAYTPPLTGAAFAPVLSDVSVGHDRPLSPPITQSPNSVVPSIYGDLPQQLGHNQLQKSVDTAPILTPPLSSDGLSRSGSKTSHVIIPARPAPAPPTQQTPSEANDEVVRTPPSSQLSHKSSTRAGSRLPPEQDPEVRRDFEARIAAATAALNRTPSTQGSKLDRKFTKRGPMVISSPTLMSSTANVPTTPLTPEQAVAPAMAKSLEKTSGSANKMSLRWKKLAGLRKGQHSLTGGEVIPFPVPPLRPEPRPATPTQEKTPASLQRSQSQAQKRLDEPIALRTNGEPSSPPNLDTFRFPSQASDTKLNPSPPASANPTTGLKHVMTKFKRGKDDKESMIADPSAPSSTQVLERGGSRTQGPPPPLDLSTGIKTSQHSSTPSGDSAIDKFIEAGRQLGLNQDQLNEMLAKKGTLARSGTTASSRSYQSTAPTTVSNAQPTPTSPRSPPIVKRQISVDKAKKGLFRALSKKGQPLQQPIQTGSEVETPEPTNEKADRLVVRRTMILPEGLVIVPSTPQSDMTPRPSDSPDSSMNRVGGMQRKQSVRRKPINLSEDDHRLVSNSPPAHKGRFSISGASSQKSDATGELQGLGFLHPSMPPGMGSEINRSISGTSSIDDSHTRSSTGGSLIDMYAGDEEEMLQGSPDKDRRPSDMPTSTQAVEICEYADGQVVWNIVDALRTSIAGSVDGEEYTFDPTHSRETSFSSSRPGSMAHNVDKSGWPSRSGSGGMGVQGLNFRHKDRNAVTQPRPPTDVFFTSSADVADLIDHLSRDLDASHGRIDILPHLNERQHLQDVPSVPQPNLAPSPAVTSADSHSSPFVYQTASSSPFDDVEPGTESVSQNRNSQYEDAPSPQRPGPGPQVQSSTGNYARTVPAGGFSPRRQLFVRQSMTIGHHKQSSMTSTIGGGAGLSPSAASFATSCINNSVEDRLQALLDKLKAGGAQANPGPTRSAEVA